MTEVHELPPAEIRLIRHAERTPTESNGSMIEREDEVGLLPREQRRALVKGIELSRRGVLRANQLQVASSPARPAIETMARVASGLGKEFNRPFSKEEIEKTADLRSQTLIQAHGELGNVVAQRGLYFLNRWARLLGPGEQMVAFSDGDLITHTVGALEGWDDDTQVARRAQMATLAETRLILIDGAWQVAEFAQPIRRDVLDSTQ